MARRPPRRTKPRDNRRGRRKVSALTIAKVEYVDYKDTELLKKFVSDRAKIRGRRVNGNDARQQREVAKAIKNAREMALISYTNRVTTQRRERRDERGGHSDGPPSRPSMPPPGSGAEVAIAEDVIAEVAIAEDGIAEDVIESVDEATLPEDVTFEATEESPAGDEPIAAGGDESEEVS
jgi:small subunit ribosomal protein S18